MNIEIGTEIIGNWDAYSPTSLGVVTSILDNGMIEVEFDDLDGYSLFRPNEIGTDWPNVDTSYAGVYFRPTDPFAPGYILN